MRKMTLGFVVLAAAAAAGFGGKLAGRQEPPVLVVPTGDPDIAAARDKAQKSLPEFLAKAFPVAPGTSKHTVKVALRENGRVEWVWLTRLQKRGDAYAGTLDNKPVDVTSYQIGQEIAFRAEDVADWIYQAGPKMAGGYSVCLLANRQGDPKTLEKLRQIGFACTA